MTFSRGFIWRAWANCDETFQVEWWLGTKVLWFLFQTLIHSWLVRRSKRSWRPKIYWQLISLGKNYVSNSIFTIPSVDPLQANIIMHNLHTILFAFLKVLTRRIFFFFNIKSLFNWWSLSSTLMCDSVATLRGEIWCESLNRVKRLITSFLVSLRPFSGMS